MKESFPRFSSMCRLLVAVILGISRLTDGSVVVSQVHLAFASTPDIMTVQWATNETDSLCSVGSIVRWGASADKLTFSASGECFPFQPGSNQLPQANHVARMLSLDASSRYFYSVGDGFDIWSPVFSFKTAPDASTLAASLPQRLLIWGDLGSSAGGPLGASTIMPYASAEVF